MRRRVVALLLVGSLLLLAAVGLLAAARGTVAEPSRACAPTSPLRLAFGEPETRDGLRVVPLYVENAGGSEARAFVSWWEVDAYLVRWDGRLSPLAGMRTDVDFIAGYEGERLAPGERARIGEWQPGDATGEVLLLAFAQQACGEARVAL